MTAEEAILELQRIRAALYDTWRMTVERRQALDMAVQALADRVKADKKEQG